MLKREPVTIETIKEDKKRIEGLLCLKNFKTRRNKFYAHFDEDYFFDPERLADDAPLTWGDFNNVIELLSEIIDCYSSAYDGQLFPLKPTNINDVDYLLDRLHMAIGPVREWASARVANADSRAKATTTEARGEEPSEK